MILLLAPEGGYGRGRRGGHEPSVRRDGDELETLLGDTRGVLGRAREDTGGETASSRGGQHPFYSLDHHLLVAVHAWSMPEALAKVRGPDEDGIQTLYTEYLLQVLQCFPRLYHGHRHDGLVRVLRVILAAVEGRPVRTVAAVSLRRVAASPDEGFRFFAGVDHRADHGVATRVEHPHYEAGIVPRHPDDGHGVRRRDSLQYRDEASIVHGPVLHIYGQAIPSRVGHDLGGEGARYVQPPVHSGFSLTPDLLQTVLPHLRSPSAATRLPPRVAPHAPILPGSQRRSPPACLSSRRFRSFL